MKISISILIATCASILGISNAANVQPTLGSSDLPPFIERNLHFSSASYCSERKIHSWECGIHCTKTPEIKGSDIWTTNDGTTIMTFHDPIQNAQIISFRGTSDVENTISDLRFGLFSPYHERPHVKVHKGMYLEYLKYRDEIVEEIVNLGLANDTTIISTGHSSGGALAMFFGVDLYTQYREFGFNQPPEMTVYSYGKPRIGNNEFVEWVHDLDIAHVRTTHAHDIIPHLPEEILGYHHTSHEIWYKDDTNYRICNDVGDDWMNEDPDCSNSCAPLLCISLPDHLKYLGYDIGIFACT